MATQTLLPHSSPLDLNNIQGDILSGLPKKTETLYFFQIKDVDSFRHCLNSFIPLVKSVAQILKDREEIDKHKRDNQRDGHKPYLIPLVGVNIAFSHFGLAKMKINDDNLVDTAFKSGQRIDAGENLGDKGTGSGKDFDPDWEPAFKSEIHGVIIVAGDSHLTVDKKIQEIEQLFRVGTLKASITKITDVRGDARPGDLSAHEHFGYLDGVSNPAIIGFDREPNPGPDPIRPGAIVLGHEGDESKDKRDPWMIDGSFLVNALNVPGLSHKEGGDLLGARLVGRWKSGAPIDLTPFKDDPELGGDPKRNNNFRFSAERDFQKMCPFAAHIRKTLPRADLEDLDPPIGPISLESRRIMRRGIQFGREVTKQEKLEKKTYHARGLLFACYQSSITNGFQFMQKSWANNATFPFGEKTPQTPGLDAIIGQGVRKLSGTNPNDPAKELDLPEQWVVPRGGEYFFSPSLKGLEETIALRA